MSVKLRILALVLLGLAVVLVVSCGSPPVSISDRIALFVTDINTNPGHTYNNCDSGATDYGASKDPAFWQALFTQAPYIASGLDDSDSSAVTVTLTGTGLPGTYTFDMTNNKVLFADNWLIRTIKDPSSTVIFQ